MASVSVWFQSKERLRNGIFGFGHMNWLSSLVLCSKTAHTLATQTKVTYKCTSVMRNLRSGPILVVLIHSLFKCLQSETKIEPDLRLLMRGARTWRFDSIWVWQTYKAETLSTSLQDLSPYPIVSQPCCKNKA